MRNGFCNLRNLASHAWYVAGTPDEIDGPLLGRQICGKRIVFFRGLAMATGNLSRERSA